MAEIRVEPRKKRYGWVWLVLLLLVLAAVVYYLYLDGSLSFAGRIDAAPALASAPSNPALTPPGGGHGST